MGKKVKTVEKGPPEDVFDVITVESRQLATVVLMLTSPEEDVLAKACESLYKFAEKCDENRRTLLEMDAVEPLLRLVSHEDRIVHRNACMALGSMAQNPDVRRSLKKREEAIPIMVSMLAPEEDTVVHEFACLSLASLAHDYSSKVTILDREGMEPLIRCLGSHDPDVQKNALDAVASLLMDYTAKGALRDLNGLPTLLELIRSEYSIIQSQALTALYRATEDAENRAVMRDLEGINKLIDFIGNPEWSDLHVFAVMVIANCLEDTESVEMIKENGGLMKLVAFVMDAAPPEEEDKGKGGAKDKGKASRAGKKGKDEDSQRGTPKPGQDKKKGGDSDSVVPTLPEVKEHAAKALARAARNASNRKMLHEQEVERLLILLLAHEDPSVQVAGAQAIGVMAENLASRDAICKLEGIEPMIKMLRNDNPEVREAASMALASLTSENMSNCHEILKLKGVEPLMELLTDSREAVIANAACVLTNMAPDEALRAEIQKQGVIQALCEPLKSDSSVHANNALVHSKVALAVAAFVDDSESRYQFQEANGVEPLVVLLTSPDGDVRRSASWAVSVVAVEESIATEICKYGGLEVLQEIQQSGTRTNAFSKLALQRLLDSNLSAKYALTGELSATNVISDEFFDVGQLRPDAKFLTLEEYCGQEVNQRRPIILVNAKAEKASTPVNNANNNEDIIEKSSKSSITGRSSRKSRAQREREERQAREEEMAAQQEGPEEEFEAPSDPGFLKYTEEVRDRIQPLPTTRDQVMALAVFVSDRMGGPIDRGQLSHFSWELPLGQLKFDLKSNVIPVGLIKAGIHYHRALLFKALADRIAVSCSLVRGQYNRAWNEVLLTDEDDTVPGGLRFPPQRYIVDLVHRPGLLMAADSPDAIHYQKI